MGLNTGQLELGLHGAYLVFCLLISCFVSCGAL